MAMEVETEAQSPNHDAMEVEEKEGRFLLGSPTFVELGDGRFKCQETGHELPEKEKESYGKSKRCRSGLIDAALRQKKAPLNFFKQDPASKSKLICKLTGDTINKSEEHIWKHISGKRFQKHLEKKEAERNENSSQKPSKSKKKGVVNMQSRTDENESMGKHETENNGDSEDADFWVPPVGDRWDSDNGNGRWEDSVNPGKEGDESILPEEDESDLMESEDPPTRTKRTCAGVGPSRFASRKKKNKSKSS
ncbi:hypothetical protein H6P81_012682 [Aristolochia fimbriata]|uniref:Surfeit locus protein 2 n=1 Tax=Aristolochia fimbriata TaxID=158543 RepID=A0AAV7ECW0_ARIFI|nr:hypothetical protein H6P81_012682 [Aristolochia fimbriata]